MTNDKFLKTILNRIDLLERCVNSIDCDIENLVIINNGKEDIVDFKNIYIKNILKIR